MRDSVMGVVADALRHVVAEIAELCGEQQGWTC